MKYIKLYENYKFYEDIDDICLELVDVGMSVYNMDRLFNGERCEVVYIMGLKNVGYSWDLLKDYALRLKDYLGDRYLSFYYTLVGTMRPANSMIKFFEMISNFSSRRDFHNNYMKSIKKINIKFDINI